MDNGYAKFTRVRIPRENMGMRFVRVDRDGKYTRVAGTDNRFAYITMMEVRAMLVTTSAKFLAKGATIATRYAFVRKQGFDATEKSEHQVPHFLSLSLSLSVVHLLYLDL